MFENDPVRVLRERLQFGKPDLIGLSVRNIDNNDLHNPLLLCEELLHVMEAIRGCSEAPVVLGGPAIGVMPENLLHFTGAQWASLGDGEAVFAELLTRLSAGRTPEGISGLGWLEDGLLVRSESAELSPMGECRAPDFGKWLDVGRYQRSYCGIPVQTKRGCPFECIYCTCQGIEGRAYRLSSPESVVEAVRGLAAQGVRDIEFVDNVFNSPYSHAMSICENLARANLPVHYQSLELHPLFIDDQLLEEMERAGFCGIGITVESAADEVLQPLKKGFTEEHAWRAAEVVRRHRLPCLWIFLFGCPGETKKSVLKTLRFIEKSLRPGDAAFFNMGVRIYPGTELESVARQEGQLTAPPDSLLKPAFYVSQEADPAWLARTLQEFAATHLNCMNGHSISFPYLPLIQRVGFKLGVKPPLWKHTRIIRKALRIFHQDL
jgi:radical SAM superfamily enzyme YgiQ (UPF0313 family)